MGLLRVHGMQNQGTLGRISLQKPYCDVEQEVDQEDVR